jgi:plastocyanin
VRCNRSFAPAHYLYSCAGVFVLLLLASACDRGALAGDKKDRTLELANDTIELPAGIDLHDVTVRTGEQHRDFDPSQSQARPGDYLRFTIDDTRTHAIVFEPVTPEQRQFLESTGQLRSPPLITKGASWVIALKNAPVGQYPFRCLVHNDVGQLTVAASTR